MFLADTMDEGDEGHGIARDSVIRPGCVEHVGDGPLMFWVRLLQE